uniref:Thrombomodulin n=1 Tax=Gouania willdenowi TaxID=441366 RepID=A0A8C5DIC5_GOUWI
MRAVRGLCAPLLLLVLSVLGGTGGTGGTEVLRPSSGTCIENQCFTLFHRTNTFMDAQDACTEQGAHLMTVRSPAAHDVITILLENVTDTLWIGLHAPGGCEGATAPPHPLRDFRWVTSDQDGNFSNWLSPPGACDAPRCVTVSQEKNFRWVEGPCTVHAEGFLCEHSFSEPCGPLHAPGDTVTYVTPLDFGGVSLQSLPPGSTATRTRSESTYVCFSGQWQQAPWNCEVHEGGCEYRCVQDPHSPPSCYCPPGHTVNPNNRVTCEPQEDDPCAALTCAHFCHKEGDTYACACDQGFQLAADGSSCVDFNDCRDGYTSSGDQCVDRDECAQAPCEQMCTNTPGSYTCSCYDGYIKDPKDPKKCALHCGKEECPAECDPNNRFQCYCPSGYVSEERGDEVFCLDMDECSFFYCDQLCTNTYGGYECRCSPGFTLVDVFKCVKNQDEDTDEGSGVTADPTFTTSQAVPLPRPTRKPSGVTRGGLAGIIVCTAVCVVLLVFLVHHLVNRRGTMGEGEGHAFKAAETHGLNQVIPPPATRETLKMIMGHAQ